MKLSATSRFSASLLAAGLTATFGVVTIPAGAVANGPENVHQEQVSDAFAHGGVRASAEEIERAKAAADDISVMSDGDVSVSATNGLWEGESLPAGESIYSDNYQYKIELGEDGQLRKYYLKWWFLWIEDWSIDVPGAEQMTMQGDGNLVITGAGDKVLWHTGTDGKPSRLRASAVLLDNGDFVVRHGKEVVWNSADGLTPGDPVDDPETTHILKAGEKLNKGDSLVSKNGKYKFTFQKNGNLVLRAAADNSKIWASGTKGKRAANRLVVQRDGNVVLYTAKDKALWNTKTADGRPKNPRLILLNRGVLVVKHGKKVVWSSAEQAQERSEIVTGEKMVMGDQLVSANGKFKFVFQKDGNCVVYNVDSGAALWSTGTAKQTSADRLVLQNDHNLVLYTSANKALWNSKTSDRYVDESRLVMQDTGLLELIHDGDVVWQSTPAGENKGNVLKKGVELNKGDWLLSKNGEFKTIFQRDGNVVTYDLESNDAVWSTGTAGKKAANRLVVQGDGNVVLYTKNNKALWNTRTAADSPRNPRLKLNNRGVLVVKHGRKNVWKSH